MVYVVVFSFHRLEIQLFMLLWGPAFYIFFRTRLWVKKLVRDFFMSPGVVIFIYRESENSGVYLWFMELDYGSRCC